MSSVSNIVQVVSQANKDHQNAYFNVEDLSFQGTVSEHSYICKSKIMNEMYLSAERCNIPSTDDKLAAF